MARKQKNVPPMTKNTSCVGGLPAGDGDEPATRNHSAADADEPHQLQAYILAHPHVMAALHALPAHERYRHRFSEALELVYVFFVAHLDEDDVDRALFALFERPDDEEARLDGKKGTTYGALSIIASDADMSYRQVERRYQRMTSRIVTAHMQMLAHDLRRYSQWEHLTNLQALLDMLVPSR